MSMVAMKLASAIALYILVLMASWVLANSCSQGEKQFLSFWKSDKGHMVTS